MRYLLFFCACLGFGQITQGNGPGNVVAASDPSLAAWSSALANAGNQITKVAVLGDSISRDNQVMFAATGPANPDNVWPRALATSLQAGGSHGPGLIALLGDANGSHLDERITLGGTWTTTNVLGPTQTGTFPYNSLYRGAAGATLDLAAQQADSFRFYCALGADSSNGFTVSIDGGSTTTICNTTGALTASLQTVSAGTAGQHTVHMVVPAGAGFGYLYGIEPTLGSTGVQVDNYSIGASRTSAYGSAVNSQLAFLDAANTASPYSLVIIALRTNDEIHANGNTSAQYQTYLSNIASHLNAWTQPPSILILDAPPLDTTQYPPWNGEAEGNYQAAEQAVVSANASHAAYLSIAAHWITAANAQALSLVGADKLHPIDKGALDIVGLILNRIAVPNRWLPDLSQDSTGNFTIKSRATTSNFVLGNTHAASANIHEYNFRQQSDGNLLLLDHTNADAFLGGWNKDGTLFVTTGLSLGGTPATTCDAAHRGTLAYTNNGAAKDNLKLCAWNGTAYAFITLY